MYLGGWKEEEFYGFGVFHSQDGFIITGHSDEKGNICAVTCVWLPSSPSWIENNRPQSVIQSRPTEKGRQSEVVGLPFISIGSDDGNREEDR
jgi:hypothetical protein